MNVAVLVPRRAGIEERDRLWAFAKTWWENDHPTFKIIEGHHDHGPFNRSLAVNLAAEQAPDADVFLVIDADVLCDPHMVRAAVDVAYATDTLTVASAERWMLSKQGTAKILDGFEGSWDSLVRQKYGTRDDPRGAQVSCCIAVSRSLWKNVGGFDELHVGYGWEDVSFRNACETVSGKATVWLAPHPIWHLHHQPSSEDREGGQWKSANEARARRYIAAHGDIEATRLLIDEHLAARTRPGPTRIPRILHRTVPVDRPAEWDEWWARQQQLHPGWEFRDWCEPLDPNDWPLTGDLWARCQNGAQKAGLIRLEYLVRFGGVHVDGDVMPVRSFEPLLHAPAFAAWEDESCVPDFVMGAEPNHPAFVLALEKARSVIEGGGDAWQSGPGVTTEVLPGRDDVLVLPPGAFAPFHYLQKGKLKDAPPPYAFCVHQWNGSWLSDAHRKSMDRRQRR